jgi:hypothetical protein
VATRALATRNRLTRRRRRGVRVTLVAAVAVCSTAAVLISVLGRATAASPAQVTAFQAAAKDPIQHWGKIEVLGMRPAIADLRQGTGVPPALIAAEARAWEAGLADIGRQLDAIEVAADLRSTMALFQGALAEFLRSARFVEQAASVPGAARGALIDTAIAAAQHGDCLYDDGGVALQQARGRAGMGGTADFPSHPCASAGGS